MLTGNPPLSKHNPRKAVFLVGKGPIVVTLPENVSQDAALFIRAALTWLVLLKSKLNKWLSRYRMYVKKKIQSVSKTAMLLK